MVTDARKVCNEPRTDWQRVAERSAKTSVYENGSERAIWLMNLKGSGVSDETLMSLSVSQRCYRKGALKEGRDFQCKHSWTKRDGAKSDQDTDRRWMQKGWSVYSVRLMRVVDRQSCHRAQYKPA